MQGKVKWFNNSKGYGFIGPDNGRDVFVHDSAIIGDGYRTLQEGDSVEYEIVQGPKGPKQLKSSRTHPLTLAELSRPLGDGTRTGQRLREIRTQRT